MRDSFLFLLVSICLILTTASSPGENQRPVYVLQPPTLLKDSLLWTLQRNYYDSVGVSAWESGSIPFYITTNPVLARSYVRLVLSYLSDLTAKQPEQLSRTDPIYIVEIGSGHGKFGFYFIKQLERIRDEYPAVLDLDIKYVMTDFTDTNVKYFEAHPSLQNMFQRGILDIATFDAQSDPGFYLRKAGKTISAETVKNPMVTITNYLIDSLSQEAFQVQDGELREGLLGMGSPLESDLANPTHLHVLSRMIPSWSFRPVAKTQTRTEAAPFEYDYYPDQPLWNQVLQWYVDTGSTATFEFPIGAFRMTRQFLSMARNGNLLMLSADKAFSHFAQFHGVDPPYIAVHTYGIEGDSPGAHSVMANYHAIELLLNLTAQARSANAFTLKSQQRDGTMQINAFVSSPSKSADFPVMRATYRQHVDDFGPVEFYFVQERAEAAPNKTLYDVLSVIKMSHYDPEIFMKFVDTLMNEGSNDVYLLSNLGIGDVLARVWDNYYRLDITKDVAFELGRISFIAERLFDALYYYTESWSIVGASAFSMCNIGQTLSSLGDYLGAAHILIRALKVDPHNEFCVQELLSARDVLMKRLESGEPVFSHTPSRLNSVYDGSENDAIREIERIMQRVVPGYQVITNLASFKDGEWAQMQQDVDAALHVGLIKDRPHHREEHQDLSVFLEPKQEL